MTFNYKCMNRFSGVWFTFNLFDMLMRVSFNIQIVNHHEMWIER